VAILVPSSLLYLYDANAFPDHIWVSRRFLTNALPMFILLALGLAAASSRARWRGKARRVARAAVLVITICAIAYPLFKVVRVQAMGEQRGALAVVRETCERLGPDAAVVVLRTPESPLFADMTPQTLRGFCGAEVAVSGNTDAASLQRLANEWHQVGRPFFVAASSADVLRTLVPNADISVTRQATDAQTLARTLTRRPSSYRSESFALALAGVAPG
jgi:hypothetical protein